MPLLDDVVDETVSGGIAPFVVAMVGDRDGVLWEGASGKSTPDSDAGPETVFRLFSQTKAIGSLGALILIDRGDLSLDTPVTEVLPDFANLQVVESVGPAGPSLRAPRTTATLRHLLTHTNGLAYITASEKMAAVAAAGPYVPDVRSGTMQSFDFPMIFDPGTDWAYSVGVDWVGRMIAKVDGRTVERFFREEVLDPLGMHHTAFEPEDVDGDLSVVLQRDEFGGLTQTEFRSAERPAFYGMGQALYGTAPDYMRFLRMVLNGGELEGTRILSPSTFELMTTNQIGDLRVSPVPATVPAISDEVNFFPGVEKTWTAAFMRVESDVPEKRRAGSLSWAGVLNSHYWVDPASNVAAVFMTQLLPFCEPRFMSSFGEFESAVYREFPGHPVAF